MHLQETRYPSESKVMAYYEFPEYRQIVEEIQQGKQWQRSISKLVAVGDTVEFFSASLHNPPHEGLNDVPEENSIRASVVVSKVEAGSSDHGKPWLIHWDAPASAGSQKPLVR